MIRCAPLGLSNVYKPPCIPPYQCCCFSDLAVMALPARPTALHFVRLPRMPYVACTLSYWMDCNCGIAGSGLWGVWPQYQSARFDSLPPLVPAITAAGRTSQCRNLRRRCRCRCFHEQTAAAGGRPRLRQAPPPSPPPGRPWSAARSRAVASVGGPWRGWGRTRQGGGVFGEQAHAALRQALKLQ